METSTKERLTGALLVVLALVIIVPELLSGRPTTGQGTPAAQNPEDGAPLRTYDVPLDGSRVAPAMPRDVPAAAAADIAAVPPPVTDTEARPAPAPASAPVAVADAPAAATKPEDRPADKPAVSAGTPAQPGKPGASAVPAAPAPSNAPTGRWWVQIGVFASHDNAQQLARKLRGAGFRIDVSQSRSKGKELYRVRAGPVADRAAASALQARLATAGEKNTTLDAP